MQTLATIGAIIEVTPWDDLQYFDESDGTCEFVDDRSPFRFRVAGKLIDNGVLYGLHGPVESGPTRYHNLICNIMYRFDDSDWETAVECGAGFQVGPTVAKRVAGYNPTDHDGVPFYLHPDATSVDGFPRISRFGGICVIDSGQDKTA